MGRLGGRAGGRRPHRADLQPRPGVLPGPRRDQARPRAVLHRRRRRRRAGAAGPAVHAAPLPHRRDRGEGAPEAPAPRRAGLGRDGARALPALEPHRRRAVRAAPGRPRVGGADVDGRVPPVELPPRARRAARRVAHRHRPHAARRPTPTCGGSRTSRTRCSPSSAPSAGRRPRAARACTSTCGSSRGGASRTCGGRRTRSRGRSGGAATCVDLTWWRKDRDPASIFVDYNQNTRDHTIRCAYSVRGVAEALVSAPIRWDEVDDADPGDFTIATMPKRFAELGDLHAGIDDAVYAPRRAAGVGRPGRDRRRRGTSPSWTERNIVQGGVRGRQLGELVVRVQAAGVGQHPHPRRRPTAPAGRRRRRAPRTPSGRP